LVVGLGVEVGVGDRVEEHLLAERRCHNVVRILSESLRGETTVGASYGMGGR
jgi:hypothetical protein